MRTACAVWALWLKQLQISFSKGLSPQIEKPRVMEFHRCCFGNDFIPHSVESWKLAHAMNPKWLKHSWGSATWLTHLNTEKHHSHCPMNSVLSSSISGYLPTVCFVLQLPPGVTGYKLISKWEHSVMEGGGRFFRLRWILNSQGSRNLENTRLGSPSSRLYKQFAIARAWRPFLEHDMKLCREIQGGSLCESSPRLGWALQWCSCLSVTHALRSNSS